MHTLNIQYAREEYYKYIITHDHKLTPHSETEYSVVNAAEQNHSAKTTTHTVTINIMMTHIIYLTYVYVHMYITIHVLNIQYVHIRM